MLAYADQDGVGDFMAEFVTKGEFEQLATRADVLEREVDGEKLVTRHILEQTRRNGHDLAAVRTRLDRIEERLDGVEEKLDGVDLKGLVRKVDSLDRKVDDLTRNLPTIVGDVMREVLRERDA
jgi:tetrahydromethanopterin S-methyltransferase subunit G